MNFPKFNALAFLVVTVTLGYFAIVAILLLGAAREGFDRDFLMVTIGVIGAKFGSIVDFFVGSSQGAAERRQADIIKKNGGHPPKEGE